MIYTEQPQPTDENMISKIGTALVALQLVCKTAKISFKTKFNPYTGITTISCSFITIEREDFEEACKIVIREIVERKNIEL